MSRPITNRIAETCGILALVLSLVHLSAEHGWSQPTTPQISPAPPRLPLPPNGPGETRPRVRELFVPFRDLHVLLEGPTRRVFLERADYEKLLAGAKRAPLDAAPQATAVTAADYLATFADGRARIVGTLTIEVLEDGLHAVTLPWKGASVLSATMQAGEGATPRPAPLAESGPEALTLFVTGKGRHRVTLDLLAPIETSAALQTLATRLPTPPTTRLRVVVPGNVDVKSGAAIIAREIDATAGVTRFELLPNRAGEPLVMTLNNRQLLEQRLLVARSVLVDEVTKGYERLHAMVSFQVVHGAADSLRLRLPAGFEVTEVKTPLLARWGVAVPTAPAAKPDAAPGVAPAAAPGAAERVLEVTLTEPVRDGLVLEVVATRTPSAPENWQFPRLEPLEVAGHAAVIGLLAEHPWQVHAVETSGLIPIDVSVLAQAIPASVATADGSAPPVRPMTAFYAPQADYSLASQFTLPSPKLRATSNVVLIVGAQRWQALGNIGLVPEVERLFAFDFTAPAGWSITKIDDIQGKPLRFDVTDAGEGRQRVHVEFSAGMAPGQGTSVSFVAEQTPAGWLGAWPAATFPLDFPLFTVSGASREDGGLAVQVADEFKAIPGPDAAFEGLTPLNENEKPKYGLANVASDFAYRYETQPYKAKFDIERVTPQMTARTHSFLRLDSEVLHGHYEVLFEVQQGKARRLLVELPDSTPQSLVVRGLRNTVVKEWGVEMPVATPDAGSAKPDAAKPEAGAANADSKAVAPGWRRWWILLAEPASAEARVAIDFTQPLAEADPKGLKLPIVRAAPSTVSYQSGLAAVEGHADLDITVAIATDGPGRPRKVDVGELAAADYVVGRRLLGAYGFIGETPELSVDLYRRQVHALPEAIVQRAELVTLLGTNGRAVTVARYQLRIKAPYLELRLPAGSTLWSGQLDGEPIAPQAASGVKASEPKEGAPGASSAKGPAAPDRLLLSISASPALARDLQIVYEQNIRELPWRGTISTAAPQLWLRDDQGESTSQVLEADVSWRVRLPSGYRVASRGGTVYPDESDATTRSLFALRPSAWVQVAQTAGSWSSDLGRQVQYAREATFLARSKYAEGYSEYSTPAPMMDLATADSSAPQIYRGANQVDGVIGSFSGSGKSEAAGMPGMPGMPGYTGPMGGGGMGGFGGALPPGMGGPPGPAGAPGANSGPNTRFRTPRRSGDQDESGLTARPASGPETPRSEPAESKRFAGRELQEGEKPAKRRGNAAAVDRRKSLEDDLQSQLPALGDKAEKQDAKPAAKDVAWEGRSSKTSSQSRDQGELDELVAPSDRPEGSDVWALEGVRSLPFDFVGFQDAQGGDLLALRSLGHEPSLELTLVDQQRLLALAWGVALLVAAWGVARSRRPLMSRLTWLAIGFLLVTALPVVAPWNHEIGTLADHVLGALLFVAAWYVVAGLCGWVGRCLKAQATSSIARPGSVRGATLSGLLIVATLLASSDRTASAQTTPPTGVPTATAPGQADPFGPMPAARAGQEQEAFEGDPRNPPGPPVHIPDDVVIIPYDHDDPMGTTKASRIFVPYEKYVELWNLANPDRRLESRPLPAPFAWAGAEYSAQLTTADDVLFTGRLRLNVFQDAPIDVPLALAGAVFTSATIDGQPAQIRVAQLEVRPQPAVKGAPATQQAAAPAQRPQQGKRPALPPALVVLTVSGKGEKLIELTVRMRQTSRGGLRLLQGQLPTAPATQLRLTVPDAKSEVAVGNGVETLRFETKQAAEVLETALRAQGTVSIQWRPQVAMGEVDRSLTSQSDAEIDVREDAVRVTWRSTLEFRGGQRDAFTFLLPAGYLLERVVGENVRGWTSRPDEKSPRVDVTLLKPAADREQVTLVLSRRRTEALTTVSSQPLPTVTPEGAALQQGVVAIRRSPLLDVRVDEVRGLSRAELPGESISESTRVAEVNPLGMRTVEALRFQTGSYAATLRVSPLPATVHAELHGVLKLDQRHANYEAQVILRVPGLPLHQLRLELPAGFELEQFGAPQPAEWSVRVGEQGQQELTLLLGAGQKGMFQVSVRGRLPRKAGEPLQLPRIGVPGAATLRGDLVVQVDPSVDVRPEELQGCEPVLLASTHGWLTEAQRPLARLALRHNAAQFSGRLVLAPRQPRVSSFTVTNVKVTGRSIAETVLIELKIEEAGIREIVFTLPKSLANARISAPLLRQKKIEPAPEAEDAAAAGDSRVRVRLALQDEVMGVFRVLIEQDRLLTVEKQEAPLPVVETGRMDQRFVTVESTSLDEVVVDEPEGFESITRQQQAWGRLTSIFGENLLQAYLVKADAVQPRLAYRTQTRSTVETVGARIALSETDLVVDTNGAYRAKQTYHVDNGTEQFLVVELPEGARLWTALVAGEPVRPQEVPDSTAKGLVRIPLVKTAAGDLDYPVVLTYGGKMPDFGVWSPVRFPFLKTNNINVELSRVRLRLPETHRWMQFGGSLGRVEEQGEYEASWLDYQTRRFQRLMDTLSSSKADSLARMRSQSNLKQLGQALGQLKTADHAGNVANVEYSRNLSLFNSTLEQAQESVQKEEAEQLEWKRKQEFDNRDRLNDLFERQRNSRASNVATQLGSNFYYAPPAGVVSGKASGGGSQFDSGWFAANGLRSTAPMNRVIMNETREAAGDAKGAAPPQQQQAGEQVEVLRGELGKRLSSQVDQVNPNANNDRSRRGGKKQEADGEVRQRYQLQLEQQSQLQTLNVPNTAQPQNGVVNPNFANLPLKESQPSNKPAGEAAAPVTLSKSNAAPATPVATSPTRPGEPQVELSDVTLTTDGAAYLTSLDVELPAGGVEYLFRTPRGDLEITAYSVSAPLMERAVRLGVVLLVVLVIVVPVRWLARATHKA